MVLRAAGGRLVAGASLVTVIVALAPSPARVEGEARAEVTATRSGPARDAGGEARDAGREPRCPDGMVLVDGARCDVVDQRCLQWMDPPPYQRLRCARFESPTRCAGGRSAMRFCIDRLERAEERSPLPRVRVSWSEARRACEAQAARLCTEREWELACEGEEALPYPYGYVRDASACNFDKSGLGRPEAGLADKRAAVTSHPRCESPYGVRNMTGNVDEWVEREGAPPGQRAVLRGGWWLPGRNRCRAATTHHGESYSGPQVGFRCCRDAAP